ncbi:hypothetical protein D3C81_608950 [compost metagenome]
MLIGVVADGEQVALAVVEEGEVHVGQSRDPQRQALRLCDTLACQRTHSGHGQAFRAWPQVLLQLCQLAPARRCLKPWVMTGWQLERLQLATQVQALLMQGLEPELAIVGVAGLARSRGVLEGQRLYLLGEPFQQRGR